MQIELNEEQVRVIVELVKSRIREIHPEIRRSRVYTVHDQLKHDLNTLQQLLDQLEQAETDEQMVAWQGYAETREIPCNPSPGGYST